jgi:ankyrin repeat protein
MSELLEAIKNSEIEKSLKLIKSGNADVNAKGTDGPPPNDGGVTCLIAAIRNFNLPQEVAIELLNHGANPNIPDSYDKETPLQALARTYPYGTEGNLLLDTLMSKGADPELQNKHGDTALHVAASSGAALICVELIKRGANYKAKDRKGKTALDIAPDVATRSSIEEAINVKTSG